MTKRTKEQKPLRRPLEALNVIDNFMFNELMMQEDKEKAKEFCRNILEPILKMKIRNIEIETQKLYQGMDTAYRGIQLDAYIKTYVDENGGKEADVIVEDACDYDLTPRPVIYDIEPNTYREIDSPRRYRLYHSVIDSHVFESGSNYGELQDVVLIIISTVDIFGMDRMLYTIRRGCIEEPDMPYNDGDTTLFLYTKGTKDIPSEELKNMLHYMEESTVGNATNDSLMAIQNMMDDIKRSRKIGVKYMINFDKIMLERQDARLQGFAEGREEGREEGRISQLQENILEILYDFGNVPDNIKHSIQKEKNMEVLKTMLKNAAHVTSIQEFEQALMQK